MARTAEVKRDARIGEAEARRDAQIKEAIAEEERMASRYFLLLNYYNCFLIFTFFSFLFLDRSLIVLLLMCFIDF